MSLTINHQTNDISATSGSVTIDGAAAGGGAWNLISTTTVSSTVSEAVIALTGSYTEYRILVHNWQTIATNGGNDILLRVGTGSSTFLSGSTDYTWALRYNRIGGSGAAQGESTSAGSSYVKLSNYAVVSTTSYGGVYMDLGISNTHSTTYPTQLKWDMLHGSETGGTNAINKVDGGALSLSTIADHTHVKLYFGGSGTSNEFNEGIFKLYGIS